MFVQPMMGCAVYLYVFRLLVGHKKAHPLNYSQTKMGFCLKHCLCKLGQLGFSKLSHLRAQPGMMAGLRRAALNERH